MNLNTKPIIMSNHTINWYTGNYILNPNNKLRENDNLMKEFREEIEKLRIELKNQKMTHKEFLEIVKQNGIHQKYYKYEKYVNNCELCKFLGIK